MRKLFVTRQDSSFLNVADIFGYLIVFFVIWIFIIGYRTVSKFTNKASNVATVQLEAVKSALPLKNPEEVKVEEKKEAKGEEPSASLIPAISGKAIEFVSTTGTKLLTKEGAKDTLNSINSYLNEVIYSTSDEVKNLDKKEEEIVVNRELKKKKALVVEEKKDELSAF